MIPATYDIPAHTAGDTFDGMSLTISINSGVPPYPLSAVHIQFRKSPKSSIAFNWSTDDESIEIIDAENWNIRIPKNIISAEPFNYFYDIQTTNSEGDIKTYVKGNWEIMEDITRP